MDLIFGPAVHMDETRADVVVCERVVMNVAHVGEKKKVVAVFDIAVEKILPGMLVPAMFIRGGLPRRRVVAATPRPRRMDIPRRR